ncbi:hypothetical protein B0H17DRAFT_1084363 [Mycena rosella]|uniref:Uncharacterized protein n=1 Tax=Mycena rosella TaxID=1033263 RepID=A0AAD7G6H3_MYCRO|nr:hypothetical protein B0H17DRAFT_1084363 [Mycena rosella]
MLPTSAEAKMQIPNATRKAMQNLRAAECSTRWGYAGCETAYRTCAAPIEVVPVPRGA